MKNIIVKVFIKVFLFFLKYFPYKSVGGFFITLICAFARELPPRDSLTFLLQIDNELYKEQGRRAVSFGKGRHTKHKHINYHEFFINRLNDKDKVIDLGCGNGSVAYSIATRVKCIVVGMDFNEANIEYAKLHHESDNIRYFVGDVFKDLPDEEFDVAILSNVLEHLTNRSELLANLTNSSGIKRILIRVPLFERDWRVPLKKELGIEWRLDPTHEIEYTIESFAKEIADAELQVNHMEVRWGEIWAEVSSG